MGSKKCWLVIWVTFFLSSVSRFFAQPTNNSSFDPDSLDDIFRCYAFDEVSRPRTGILYNVSLPANFSGMELSFVRLRTRKFWLNGANLSYFRIPSGNLPVPFVMRFYLVYQNLGNWSNVYYKVPNYTFIAPVVGLVLYNASHSSPIRLDVGVNRDPILVQFPWISFPEKKNVTLQCARFDANGSVELTEMTLPNACVARNAGHFTIVAPPSPPRLPPLPPPSPVKRKKDGIWKLWVLGFGLGILGMIMVALLGFLTYKIVKRSRMGKMERQSERNEALETTWIGRSKMPSATGIRTQPTIENEYVP
ncbi:uncharacterized protein LOC131334881 [Rhododendron vialii]|uniref:uncharacterized protein LOC131334881 n=1 Tax=Rhododendron vialii TaxID=182163 RepID=UPI00265F84C2|nr:uncharacterized protein LOC131334881 [Rhododendron vialii]